MSLASSAGSSYKSLSVGSPGSMRFKIPSRPAIKIAAKHKYGLLEASGARNSTRLALTLLVTGIREIAERLRCELAKLTGASKPGTRRRKELVVGEVNASKAGACLRIPPM